MCETRFLGFVPQRAIVIEPAKLIECAVDPCRVAQTVLRHQHVVGQIDTDYPPILVIDRMHLDAERTAIGAPDNAAVDRVGFTVDHPDTARLFLPTALRLAAPRLPAP